MNRHLANLGRLLRLVPWAVCFLLMVSFSSDASLAQVLPGNRSIVIRVRDATGAPLPAPALVKLTSNVGNIQLSAYTEESGYIEFRGLTVDEYRIEVSAPGYTQANESVTLPLRYNNLVPQLYILLQKTPNFASVTGAAPMSAPPPRSSKIQKEVQKALEKLQKHDLKSAQKQLEKAQKSAPKDPGIEYLFGVLFLRRQMPQQAQEHLEKAVGLYQGQVPALRLLARLKYQKGDLAGAASALEQALATDSRSAGDQNLLAEILLQQGSISKAAFHAQMAVDLSGGKQPEMRLLLCQILLAQGEQQKAAESLEAYLRDFPAHEGAPVARSVLAQIQQRSAADKATAPAPMAEKGVTESLNGYSRSSESARVNTDVSSGNLESNAEPGWAPPDVDEAPPATFRDVQCNMQEVLSHVQERVRELAGNLGDVNAEENILHTDIDKKGRPIESESRRYDYAISITASKDGALIFNETRNGLFGIEGLRGFATSALTSMAMVFHPYFADDFAMSCEGQSVWQGQPVWLIHFRQRDDKAPRIHSLVAQNGKFQIPLKGRAWIAANSYQIIRLETGMIMPIEKARLDREQMIIEYAPVHFEKRKLTFWLPASADIYVQFKGKRWHRRHSLQNYIHFAVETQQKIAPPKTTEKPPEL